MLYKSELTKQEMFQALEALWLEYHKRYEECKREGAPVHITTRYEWLEVGVAEAMKACKMECK